VTLGMLSIARSLAIVLSQNRVIYQLGPGGEVFKAIGGGQIALPWFGGQTLYLSNLFITLLVLAVIVSFVLKWTAWGRHLFAIGGNENAARLTGIPVDRIKLQVYMFSGLTAAIAATVIGGANLMGGQGSVYGAVIGAALIFLIRNSLIMFGVDANWYDLFVGLFIIFAVLLERIRARTSG
jgi:ribose transport system permease protein